MLFMAIATTPSLLLKQATKKISMVILSTLLSACSGQSDVAQVLTKQQQSEQQLVVEISQLKDNTGLVYVGAKIKAADIAVYLSKMEKILGSQAFAIFRANQGARDQHSFHITLINPFEYRDLGNAIELGQSIAITLQGLALVQAKNDSSQQSYFVVVSSPDGQTFRQKQGLNNKDLHVTLGFDPQDIYNMSKGIERLIE
jgi:hypothetical protein